MSQALFRGRRVLWLPFAAGWSKPEADRARCCEAMRTALDFSCDQHEEPFECADALMIYNPVFDEYGIPVHDGGASYVLISHCPWCGGRLPESQRDRWFDETAAFGDGELPEEYLSDAWRDK